MFSRCSDWVILDRFGGYSCYFSIHCWSYWCWLHWCCQGCWQAEEGSTKGEGGQPMLLHRQQPGHGRLHGRQGAVQGSEELWEGLQRGGDERRDGEQWDVQAPGASLFRKKAARSSQKISWVRFWIILRKLYSKYLPNSEIFQLISWTRMTWKSSLFLAKHLSVAGTAQQPWVTLKLFLKRWKSIGSWFHTIWSYNFHSGQLSFESNCCQGRISVQHLPGIIPLQYNSHFVPKFEHALALFLRGTRLAPDSTVMVMGITKCKKAILSKVTDITCMHMCPLVPSGVRERCLLLSWIQEFHWFPSCRWVWRGRQVLCSIGRGTKERLPGFCHEVPALVDVSCTSYLWISPFLDF